eukprot:1185986-Prorocentrum_minimum.AAC.5
MTAPKCDAPDRQLQAQAEGRGCHTYTVPSPLNPREACWLTPICMLSQCSRYLPSSQPTKKGSGVSFQTCGMYVPSKWTMG